MAKITKSVFRNRLSLVLFGLFILSFAAHAQNPPPPPPPQAGMQPQDGQIPPPPPNGNYPRPPQVDRPFPPP
ncbi:MAG: hypothetical protein ABIP02_09170, partial [Arenimonas sp.]